MTSLTSQSRPSSISSSRTNVTGVLAAPRSSLAEANSPQALASNILAPKCPSQLKLVEPQSRKRLRATVANASDESLASTSATRRRCSPAGCVRSCIDNNESAATATATASVATTEDTLGTGTSKYGSCVTETHTNTQKAELGKRTREEAKKDHELCLICMDPFTDEFPASQIPCKKRCNSAPVHEKCIYEWQEFQPGKSVVSCPLCRSKLYPISYLPPDAIRSNTLSDFSTRKSFLLHPVPREAGVVRCYINAVRTGFFSVGAYELYLQAPTTLEYPLGPLPDHAGPREGDRLLAVARKQVTAWGCAQLDMSMDTKGVDFDDRSKNYLGCVQSSFSGLDHSIQVPHVTKDGRASMCDLAAVRYTQNRIRSTVGPRRVQVCLPAIKKVKHGTTPTEMRAPLVIPTPLPGSRQYRRLQAGRSGKAKERDELIGESGATSASTPCSGGEKWASKVYGNEHETLAQVLKRGVEHSQDVRDQVMFAKNKDPYWLEAIQAYSLDFQGRVTLPSNKNFQLLMENCPVEDDYTETASPSPRPEVVLQFGKVEDNLVLEMYTMDVQWPLSPLQAFGICLSACDRKLLLS